MDRESMQDRFGIIGGSAALRHVLDRVRQVSGTDITILIQGESGVGKELFAQAIHQTSPRRHKPMLIVNCGAIPEGLIESELFGNEKGAYTGAVERRSGYFEEANTSTIFLDEIGEMPLTAQVRLLRVLETGEFSRVGSSNVLRADVRVVAATNKDLAREVEAGRFREDLYYRLSTVILLVPPLRERKEDILPLFTNFHHRFSQKYNSPTRKLDEQARALILRYRWPGNVRELRNVAEQTVVLLKGDRISVEDIRPYLRGVSATSTSLMPVPRPGDGDGTDTREREIIYRALLELRSEVRELKESISALVSRSGPEWAPDQKGEPGPGQFLIVRDEPTEPLIEDVAFEIDNGLQTDIHPGSEVEAEAPDDSLPTLEDSERSLIFRALERFEGNRRQTAHALGISERTLYRKIKEFESGEKRDD
jgi:DNA-binding NtrC family response regulator